MGLPVGGGMSYSLSEATALCLKAARGSGMTWGYAQEAAYAAIWLEERGCAGIDALCTLLHTRGRHNSQSGALLADSGPIALGCKLTDLAPDLWFNDTYDGVIAPLLMLPYIHQYAALKSLCIHVQSTEWQAWSDGQDLHVTGTPPHQMQQLTLSRVAQPAPKSPPLRTRVDLTQQHLDDLNSYAHRTYAPATEASRLAGAGAGLNDND